MNVSHHFYHLLRVPLCYLECVNKPFQREHLSNHNLFYACVIEHIHNWYIILHT